ncbi:uncharacterized protein RHOBADRAFT_47212 [Rhodotorula graminis WP1]|uniref:Uncharacterized protein n=1 Tax=Rhodotorula graminis (strain WP1) TaxID=578459 RepID=A0A0N8PZD6_RHOGW|nr:uncharacterized protein RHOBADRAFT_47212 [Rhodotorula graminis WP1]KPV72029.1 hypothetical protein RHOBADRAFT_47212 [Rhodotorula graminis WP1]
MPLAPPLVTRDLTHSRKLPGRQAAFHTVADAFLSLLASPEHPLAPALRAVFLPALLGIDAPRPRDNGSADEQLRRLFEDPPQVVLLQTVPSAEGVDAAWKTRPAEMLSRVFAAFPLHSELERAKGEGEQEEVANLSMMVIATLTYELAHWIFVKAHGYRPHDAMSDTASLYTTTTAHSVSSIHSSRSLLAPHRDKDDVGTRAVLALLGCEYELLTYTIGERELVKRRYPTRRSAALQPPGVFFLIGDTPAIRDCTTMSPTASGMVPPHREGDSMYAVTSVLTPAGMARMHGNCTLGGGGGGTSVGAQSVQGVKVSLDAASQRSGAGGDDDDDDDDGKGLDPMYSSL